jgi:hypothetical protein
VVEVPVGEPAFFWFLQKLLPTVGGVIEQEELEATVLKHSGASFGPNDLRPVKCGRGGTCPKWRNTLAFAKVMSRQVHQDGEGNPTTSIRQRSRQEGGKRRTYLVLLDSSITPAKWIAWVLGRKRKKMNPTRPCKRCKTVNALDNQERAKCGAPFPPKAERKHKIPR